MEEQNLDKIKKCLEFLETGINFTKVLKVYCENDIEQGEISETLSLYTKETLKVLNKSREILKSF